MDVSPPYFIPMPLLLTGTFGAVIRMRGPVESRDALLDIGAAGPIAGFVVAIPVLIHGIATSSVMAVDLSQHPLLLGDSLLSAGLVFALKGPIPAGYDVVLSPSALAGWAGLLITMMNLVPAGQLDGGHVAYALFGARQNDYTRWVLHGLLLLALAISGYAVLGAWQQGQRHSELASASTAGVHWGLWWLVLTVMARITGDHPPTEPSELSPLRRIVGFCTLALFVLLFMPTWLRET